MITPEIGAVIGGMRLDAVAGRGGMGIVYRAHQLALDRTVALKIVNPALAGDAVFRERFRREARLAAVLEHPHVVPVFHAGEADGHLYLAMRFVEGTDLATMIREHGRIAPHDAAEIVAQIANALDEAHARGLVHRDVKPANVLVTRPAGRWHAYLTDFGISKDIRDAGLTQEGEAVGTLSSMAPEQLEGGRIDGRADVYSLGCVLFQALTGRPPFPDNSIGALMYAHIHTPPPEVGGPLGPVLARALAKRPDDRYPSAGAFGHAVLDAVSRGAAGPVEVIRPWVPPHAVSAPPPGLAPPTWTDVPARKRSRRWLLVGGCLALVVAVGAAIVQLVPAGEATPSETGAEASETAFPTNPAGRIGSPIPVGPGPRDLADGEGYIWTANTGGGSISRVQPGTGASTEIVVDGQPNQIVVGNGKAWVWNYSSALTPVDAVTGLVGPLVYTQFDIAAIAAGRDAVWFTSDAGVVGRVDMVSASVSEVFNLGGRPGSISIGDGKIYVLDRANQTLVTIDEASRTLVGAPAPLPEGLTAVYAVGKDVYLVGPSGVARLGAEPLAPDQVVQYDSGIGAIAVGPDSAWVCDDLANELHRVALDLRTPVAAPLQGIGDGCGDMEVFDGLLWFANRIDGTVTRIDPAPL